MAICGNCKADGVDLDHIRKCFGVAPRSDWLLHPADEPLPPEPDEHEVAEDPWAAEPEVRRVSPYGISAVQQAYDFLGAEPDGPAEAPKRELQRVYLDVPYQDKDIAKHEFGAKFDWTLKKWWVLEDANFDAMPDKWYLASESDSALADRQAASSEVRGFAPVNEDGIYLVLEKYRDVLNAEYIKVQYNREGSRMYAKQLRELFPPELKLEPNPKNAISLWAAQNGVDKPVEWHYTTGLLRNMGKHMVEKLGIEDAAQFGDLYGICMRCGAFLTNEESIARGMGPVCAGKWN
ncbi:hypothetical protein SEA_DUMPTRUCK_46 [Gordonia phage DumpTruck]|nr:hypothetical protein SEA_DUMPTRUCK_46 [Gordonia phage DumpTruck]